MAALFEIVTQFAIVVDLAVEDYRYAFVFVVDRLFAGNEIDNREPAHAQRNASRDHQAFRIRTAMHHALAHPVQQIFRAFGRRSTWFKTCPASDSAHQNLILEESVSSLNEPFSSLR